MREYFDQTQLFEEFFRQTEDVMLLADAAEIPYLSVQIFNVAYNILFKEKVFPDECKIWCK